MKRIVTAGAAVLLGAVVIAGCSQSDGNSGGPAPPEKRQTGGQVSADSGYAPAGDSAGAGGGSTGVGRTDLDLTDPRALIRTADLDVAVKDAASLPSAADKAGQIAVTAGGEVYADTRTSGEQPSASLTLKVPPTALTQVLDELAALGTEQSRNLSTRDVTTQVADVEARLASARESIARLRALFDKATRVSDVIAIESELQRRQADLESLEAQQRSLASQTSMATVQLTLMTGPVAVDDDDDRGFVAGLKAGWDNFTDAAAWVATALGAVLPFLVLVLLVAGGIVVVLKRHPRRVVPPPAAPTEG